MLYAECAPEKACCAGSYKSESCTDSQEIRPSGARGWSKSHQPSLHEHRITDHHGGPSTNAAELSILEQLTGFGSNYGAYA